MVKEFKEFAMKGNVVDLATGVIIGAAFGKIVSSLVNDIVMPLISAVTGKIDFANMFISLDGQKYATLQMAKEAGTATLNYGVFFTNIIDFLIISLSIFIIIKQISRFKKKDEVVVEVTTKNCPYCQSSIDIKAVRCPHCTSEI
ncbi:MAG TPA: large conductance mechanosensitive channel protein MscL [Clostridia bacterium]|nr:large conductance mechanosensitive channel protein MscL [Clostridia bacterium]